MTLDMTPNMCKLQPSSLLAVEFSYSKKVIHKLYVISYT